MNGVLVVHSERGAVLFAKAYAGGFGLKLDEPADPGEDQEQGDEGDDPQPPPPAAATHNPRRCTCASSSLDGPRLVALQA
jgi:hypothetical protein